MKLGTVTRNLTESKLAELQLRSLASIIESSDDAIGALSAANGQVDLNWSSEADGRLCVRWTETGGPKVQEPTHKGFGRRIIEQMISQLQGKARFDWRPEGLACEITLRV
jgi:hypothetical protein